MFSSFDSRDPDNPTATRKSSRSSENHPPELGTIRLVDFLMALGLLLMIFGLFLPGAHANHEKAFQLKCANNLKQIGLASHNYHGDQGALPEGATSPGLASSLVQLLPYLGQGNKLVGYDANQSINTVVNYYARVGDVPVFLCPSDPSGGVFAEPASAAPSGVTPGNAGRSNYFGNAGAHAWWQDSAAGSTPKPDTVAGIFGKQSKTSFAGITDGLSNTVAFAEVRRSTGSTNTAWDAGVLSPAVWGTPATKGTNPNNFGPLPAAFATSCNGATTLLNKTGLQYYLGQINTALYTHTLPPNYTGRDCMALTADQIHLAARSYHPGGVYVCLCDGSVRFVKDSINFATWAAMGTRAGSEVALADY